MKQCKFCNRTQTRALSKGYCVSCYQYFEMHKYDTWNKSEYGELARVQKEDSPQYGWPICHICGRAYSKLQQHIWYTHDMVKREYCKKFGIDVNINMTSEEYHNKMRDYAYENNMDNQLKEAGKSTRYKKGHSNNYERSPMTQARLKTLGETTIHENRKYSPKLLKEKQEALDYINSFDEVTKSQFIKVLNSPVNELGVDQLRLKCKLLCYDIEKIISIEENL